MQNIASQFIFLYVRFRKKKIYPYILLGLMSRELVEPAEPEQTLALRNNEWTPEIEEEFRKLHAEAVAMRFICQKSSQLYIKRSRAYKIFITVVSSVLTLMNTATATNPVLAQSIEMQVIQLLISTLLTVATAVFALLAYDRRAEQLRKVAMDWGSIMMRAQYLFRFDDERRLEAKKALECMWDDRNKMDATEVILPSQAWRAVDGDVVKTGTSLYHERLSPRTSVLGRSSVVVAQTDN